ncbi:transposable element Tcb1 transposase [Trichonephila clavipes]|nr:transposable element Tcb1 transposase [Trichonephila clavipes]
MSRRKQRKAFGQVSEFDRERIVAYRDCGLPFRKIGSRVGRNQTTVMQICDRWMQERLGHSQDNAGQHVTRIVQSIFAIHQIELLLWPAHFPNLSLIENMWSMVVQRLTQITPPAAIPDQLWHRAEAAWSAVPQEHIQSIFESMPRRVAATATLATDSGRNHTSQKSINLII